MAEPELIRWVQAAAAYRYGGKGLTELARHIRPSIATLYRRGKSGGLHEGERVEIHRKTGVPEWFLEGGWENYPGATGRGAGGDQPSGPDDPGRRGARGLGPLPGAGEGGAEPPPEEETGS